MPRREVRPGVVAVDLGVYEVDLRKAAEGAGITYNPAERERIKKLVTEGIEPFGIVVVFLPD